jgi:hypothetical protein
MVYRSGWVDSRLYYASFGSLEFEFHSYNCNLDIEQFYYALIGSLELNSILIIVI